MMAPQPSLTVGAGGANGNIITFTGLLGPHAPVPVVPAGVLPHTAEVTYFATMEWQPGVTGMVGVDVNAPPSMLYWVVKPVTAVTAGSVNADAQVFAGAVNTGAAGNTTTLTILPGPHNKPLPVVPANVLPQSAVKTYRARTV